MKLFGGRLLPGLVDTLAFDGRYASASQSCLLPAQAVSLPGWLFSFGEGYFRFLNQLPPITTCRSCSGSWSIALDPALARLELLRFAPPYLAAARNGRELRYPIVGGLMVGGPAGHLAFGAADTGSQHRIWIDVVGYWPRLGTGRLYRLSQVRVHRAITVAYLAVQHRRAHRLKG